MIGDLAGAGPPAQRRTMETVVAFLNEHIRPHAGREAKKLAAAGAPEGAGMESLHQH